MAKLTIKDDGYDIKEIQENEVVECPDDDAVLHRIGHKLFKLTLKKGHVSKRLS